MGPGRLNALIDGVFAIALTLLVLDLPKPAVSTQLVHVLLHQWPSSVAYLVSFVTIGILWIEHHGMMSAIRGINRRFLERTLAFLLFVSIIPWPTASRRGVRRPRLLGGAVVARPGRLRSAPRAPAPATLEGQSPRPRRDEVVDGRRAPAPLGVGLDRGRVLEQGRRHLP